MEERASEKEVRADVVVEISWEVCNKVGGIYTVVTSKLPSMRPYYKDYFAIGPYFKEAAQYEFAPAPAPSWLEEIFLKLKGEGITCHFGFWQIKGEPPVILIDHRNLFSKVDELKKNLWDWYGVDSLKSGWDFSEPIVWSWACARLLEELGKGPWAQKNVLSHHHEWLAGLSLLFLKKFSTNIKSVFTTHATMLGRSIAGNNQNLYELLDVIDPTQKAYELGVADKFLTEKACAHTADVFTTVSEITGIEAEKLLGKKPDVLTLNGFDASKFPTIEETSIKHVHSRGVLREFQTYHFFPYYQNFDLQKNLMFCISGRYEYGNKGMNLFVDALAKLNEKLIEQESERTITVFFWLLAGNKGVRSDVLENKSYYSHIKNYVQWHSGDILEKVTLDFISGKSEESKSSASAFYTDDFMEKMRKDVLHFKRKGNPPLSTHRLWDEDGDQLKNHLLRVGLDNRDTDKVKVVIMPCFLDGNDSILNLPYYDALAGAHLSVFPSYYEPWGYTPLESIAMGVPSITSDVAGFGAFMKKHVKNLDKGMFVLDRKKESYDTCVNNLFSSLLEYSDLSHDQRVENKIVAKQLSTLADWKNMIGFYIQAHNLAFEK